MKKYHLSLYIVVALAFSLGFSILESFLQRIGVAESIIAIIACSHNLVSTLVCGYVFAKNCKDSAAVYWAAGFVVVGVADVFHATWGWIYPLDLSHVSSVLSNELYDVFILLNLVALYKSYKPKYSRIGKFAGLSTFVVSATAMVVYISFPFWQTKFPLYLRIIDLPYDFMVASFVGMLMMLGLRTRNLAGLIFVSSYLLIFCSDFAVRYYDHSATMPRLSIFNFTWELGFAINAALLLWLQCNGKSVAKELFEKLPYNSLRFQISTLGLVAVVTFVVSMNVVSVPRVFWSNPDISITLTLFLITWCTTNAAALWFSRKLCLFPKFLNELSELSSFSFEIEGILDVFKSRNKQLTEANAIIEKQKTAIEMNAAQIAHDVRKPLASMKALLSSLPAIKDDPVSIEKMIVNVDRNIAQTNAMLNDVLEFSRDATALDIKSLSPQSIITSALGDALRNHPKMKVSINYDFKHQSVLDVDGTRIMRVL